MSPDLPEVFETVAADDAGLRLALTAERMPTADLAAGAVFWRLRRGEAVVGYAGLEIHGGAAMLRSLVILPDFKGGGSGKRLVDWVRGRAREAGLTELWLLTATAADFFCHLGWQMRDRSEAPDGIRQSAEFRGLCPASAACFSLKIRDMQKM